jgi:hypothetical protein
LRCSAATNSTYDQIPICSILVWEGEVQQKQLLKRGKKGKKCEKWKKKSLGGREISCAVGEDVDARASVYKILDRMGDFTAFNETFCVRNIPRGNGHYRSGPE